MSRCLCKSAPARKYDPEVDSGGNCIAGKADAKGNSETELRAERVHGFGVLFLKPMRNLPQFSRSYPTYFVNVPK